MKVIAAYLLAVLGGNNSPTAEDIRTILGSGTVGAEAEDEKIELLLSQVKGKDIAEVVACGREKMASLPIGGVASVGALTASGGDASAAMAAPVTAEAKKEEKKEDVEDSDDDICFALFDE